MRQVTMQHGDQNAHVHWQIREARAKSLVQTQEVTQQTRHTRVK